MLNPHAYISDSLHAARHMLTATRAALILPLGVVAGAAAVSDVRAEVLDYISVGGMYMAYFSFDSDAGKITWANASAYTPGAQVLRPLSATHPGDYYSGNGDWAQLLNPHAQGGQDAASSRLFGFSLTGGPGGAFASYLSSNGYSLAIRLESITYTNGGGNADNAGVYYYNYGNDDWGGPHEAKAEWSQLTDANYLIWNGQSFSNMLHPVVASTDTFATDYTVTYTLSIVSNSVEEDVNATVVNTVNAVPGVDSLTFSYVASSLGATAVPEPSVYAALLAAASLGGVFMVRRSCRGQAA